MPWWNDLEDEDELADRWQKERTKLDGFIRAYSRKPEIAKHLSDWADHAPMLPRTVLLAFAKAKVDPESKLGRWAIGNAVVAMDTRKRERNDILTFLGTPSNARELERFSDRRVGQLERMNPDEIAGYGVDELSRLRRGKDPTPEPGGVRGVFHDVGDVATAGTRGTFGALQAGYEGVQAGFRAAVGGVAAVADPNAREQAANAARGRVSGTSRAPDKVTFGNVEISTSAATLLDPKQITLYNMIRGEDSGSGIFPAGEAAETQRVAARDAAAVVLPDGSRSAMTPGRFAASMVLEPGTEPYNIASGVGDFVIATGADPANLALGKAADVRRARKLFTPEAAGAYRGPRKLFHGPTFTQWADGPGAKKIEGIAKTTEIRTLRRKLGADFPARLLAPLQDATDPNDVRAILQEALAGGATKVPTWGLDWRKPAANIRWFSQMPHGSLHYSDLGNNLEQVERLAVTAKVPGAEVERLMSRAARIETQSDLADFAFHDLNDSLVSHAVTEFGVDPIKARKLFRFFGKQQYDEMRQLANDELANPLSIDTPVTLGGDSFRVPGPHLENELLNQAIPLPDARDIRHNLSRLGPAINNQLFEGLTDAGDWFMQDFWKPMVLLRGAWTVRVIGEEQVRMAASGLDSMFSHPMSWIAYATKKKGDLDLTGKSFEDIADDVTAFDDPFVDALSKRGQGSLVGVGSRSDDVRMLGDWTTYTRGPAVEAYGRAWADELSHLYTSPTVREVARDIKATGTLDNVKQKFWDGDLAPIREKMARANLWEGRSSALLAAREGSDAYIDSVFKRLQAITGEDADLIDGLATGSYFKGGKISKDLRKKLGQLELEEVGPQTVRGQKMLSVDTSPASRMGARLDSGVKFMFNALMTVPTNKLSRSVAFKQFYWNKVQEILPHMDDATQQQIMRVAKNSKIKLKAAGTSGTLGLEAADQVAKAHSLDSVRKLLYDTSERSHGFDALRLVFPFGEAFKEVTTRWAKLAVTEPRVIRRGQQLVYGARGAGFFKTDPETGEEHFVFPFAQHLTKALGAIPGVPDGIDFPMRARVQGLNIIGNGLPGVGPVVQWPVSKLIGTDPKWDWIREFVSPYGDPETEQGLFEAFFPGYAQRMRAAGWLEPIGIGPSAEQERIFENAVKDSMNFLASSGAYDLAGENAEAEMNRLADDARDYARRLYFWRGAAQYVAPSAPQYVPQIRLKDGRMAELYVVAQDYQRILQKNDGDWAEATVEFVDRYGPTAYMALEPRGKREVYGAPTTRQAEAWRENHKSFARSFPDVYGYFAPQDGDRDYDAYKRSVARGDIVATSADDWLRSGNDRVASAVYQVLRAKVPPNPAPEQRRWLAEKQAELVKQFPGYDPDGFSDRTSREAQIAQLKKAVTKKDVKDTTIAEAASIYLTLRDKALAEAGKRKKSGATSLDGKDVAHLREWLREKGAGLVLEHPEFTALWDGVFAGEVELTREELDVDDEAA
jgi:hypothetical protein